MKIFEEKIKSEGGLSLIELILVIVLMSIVVGFVYNIIFYEVNIYDQLVHQTEGLQVSRNALNRMARDLREIVEPDKIFQASDDSLRFENVNSEVISYKYQNTQILRNGNPLADSITEFQFEYSDTSNNVLDSPVSNTSEIYTIEIDITASINGESFDLNTRVQPRNF